MTRKDFELIAEVLRKAVGDWGASRPSADTVIEDIAWTFAQRLRATNPRFDAERFLKAAGAK